MDRIILRIGASETGSMRSKLELGGNINVAAWDEIERGGRGVWYRKATSLELKGRSADRKAES